MSRYTVGQISSDDHRDGHWCLLDADNPFLGARWGAHESYKDDIHRVARDLNEGRMINNLSWENIITGDYVDVYTI